MQAQHAAGPARLPEMGVGPVALSMGLGSIQSDKLPNPLLINAVESWKRAEPGSSLLPPPLTIVAHEEMRHREVLTGRAPRAVWLAVSPWPKMPASRATRMVSCLKRLWQGLAQKFQ